MQSVPQLKMRLNNSTCCHTEIKDVDQTCFLIKPKYADTRSNSPSINTICHCDSVRIGINQVPNQTFHPPPLPFFSFLITMQQGYICARLQCPVTRLSVPTHNGEYYLSRIPWKTPYLLVCRSAPGHQHDVKTCQPKDRDGGQGNYTYNHNADKG